MKTRHCFALLLATVGLVMSTHADDGALAGHRHRVIVTSDIGGTDPDDYQSMAHVLLYADVLDIEGLVSSPFERVGKDKIFEVIDAYEKDYANLRSWSERYPEPDTLRAMTKQGGIHPAPYSGLRGTTEGSDWIVACARRDDPRPLHILVWGALEELAQALHDAPDILPKLRVHYIGGPNKKWGPDAYQYLADNFPTLWIIESNSTYRGYFIGGNQEGEWGNEGFVTRHVAGRGAMGKYFAEHLGGVIKMGDTPTVNWLLRGNLADPSQPGWGGRYVRAWDRPFARYDRLTTAADRLEVFGILELVLPLGPDAPSNPEGRMIVTNQSLIGHPEGQGNLRFRFCPRDPKLFTYEIRSNAPGLDGRKGAITAFLPDAVVARNPSSRFPNWWTDDPSPAMAEGIHHGAKSVSQWRENFLRDFATRMERCRIPASSGESTSVATLAGDLKQWHRVTLDVAGPFARETDLVPNPFTDYRFDVVFEHASGAPRYIVPGYFAADGKAGETGAEAGNVWRAHLSPDKPGQWKYRVIFTQGPGAAITGGGTALAPYDGLSGSFEVAATDKTGRDFRAKGRLQYVGGHHLRFAGSGDYFIKAGPDSPETFLGSADFDNTVGRKSNVPLKTWAPHVRDWSEGDPTWRDGRGKGMIGALNYLASKGLNSFSFLPYNAGGDGDNVWPFVARDDKLHYDCSKLDQWEIVFTHAQRLGLYLHFKLQETENDDQRRQRGREAIIVPEALDGGLLGPERKLYLRELIARFGHHLALNWNLGEENTQTPEEQRAMAQFIADTDPYGHHRVIHTYPNEQELVYEPLLGVQSALTGASLQNMWHETHARTVQWIRASATAGKPWVVANDEQGTASSGVPPDPGYRGFEGTVTEQGHPPCDLHDIRRSTLWGNLLAGGAGVEYYFGYKLAENDLVAEDFRSRDQSWDYCRIALDFFAREKIPFWKMKNADELVGNPSHDNSRYCLAQPGGLYLVYLPQGGEGKLDLTGVTGAFDLRWFNPRDGAMHATTQPLGGGGSVQISAPNQEDWLAVIRLNVMGKFPTGHD